MVEATSRYWRFIRLSARGQVDVKDEVEVRQFLIHHFGPSGLPSDSEAQRTLWAIAQGDEPQQRRLAIQSLRCFIGACIEQTCRQLVAQFGLEHGFTLQDLLPYVLDDEGRPLDWGDLETAYPSLAVQALKSFDPSRASLSTWVSRLVKHHRELNAFLLQQGVYLVSDWAILNDTRPNQLRRILTEFHGLAIAEVEAAIALLHSYHQVYRNDRLQQRLSGSPSSKAPAGRSAGQCLPPAPEQLQRMLRLLGKSPAQPSSTDLQQEAVMNRLKTLAAYLRQYRIHVRSGLLPTESLDRPDAPVQAIENLAQAAADPDDSAAQQQAFLAQFRQQLLSGLDVALDQVVGDRLTTLQRRQPTAHEAFLEGLHLFHCGGKSMGDIAHALGLKAQYQVTRLLKLKEFRADVRQRLLLYLGDRVRPLAEQFADPDQLQQLDQQLELALSERVDALMQQAETEASVPRQEPLKSLFARRLCHHLNARRNQP